MLYQWSLKKESNIPWVAVNDSFSEEEIESIIRIGKSTISSTQIEAALGYDKTIDTSYRKCITSWIKSDIIENQWIFQKLSDVINKINNDYFKFDIRSIETLQFTEYTSDGDFYKRHLDMGYEEANCRKISFSIQLSNDTDYSGGDLVLYYTEEGEIANKKKGTLTAFPSYVLHEVLPVTQGTRYALVGWITGPKFK